MTEDEAGTVVEHTPARRVPPAWMVRQVRYRDRGCTFPGCGTRAFARAHHIRFWSRGGRTELSNLALICSFHHRLVHEWGWGLAREPDGDLRWSRPDGRRYLGGPSRGDPALADTG
ncbi:MAG: HNH endonuclease signature motif containing protein [Actinomycetota bacterium]